MFIQTRSFDAKEFLDLKCLAQISNKRAESGATKRKALSLN
jgi:hypothetical protein